MAIPDFQSIMLPLLQYARDGQERSLRATIDALAHVFQLSEEERRELLPSGAQPIFDNRVGWARTYLKKAGLLTATRRGYAKITPRGEEVLAQQPEAIDTAFLKQFDDFVAFQTRSQATKDAEPEDDGGKPRTPEEAIEEEFRQLRQDLADELLEAIKAQPPDYFERLVIDLLLAMGYGGSRRDAGQAVGKSGDGGIDGIFKQDRLGLDVIYVQAKRWQEAVDELSEIINISAEYRDAAQLLTHARLFQAEARTRERTAELYDQGLSHYNDERWQQAIGCFDQVVVLDPNHRQARYLRSEAHRYQLWSQSLVGRIRLKVMRWFRHTDKGQGLNLPPSPPAEQPEKRQV